MANVPPSGGPEYRNSFIVKHDTRDLWVVMKSVMENGLPHWAPMIYGDDKIDLSIDAAKLGFGAPKELTLQNTYQPDEDMHNELIVPYVAGKTHLHHYVERESYDKIQELASTPLDQPAKLTKEQAAELYEDAKDMLNRKDNPLQGSVNEQLKDLESTLRAQRIRQNNASQLMEEAKGWNEEDKAQARATYNAERKATRDLEERIELLDIAANGPRYVRDRPFAEAGFDENTLAANLELGLDKLADDMKFGYRGDDDPPEAHAGPAKPNRPTGPSGSDSGAEAELPAPDYEAPTSAPEAKPGHMGTQSHADAMAFAEWSMAQNGFGASASTPVSEIAKQHGVTPTDVAAKAFPNAHEAVERTAQITKSTAKPKARAAGKVLKRGGRR